MTLTSVLNKEATFETQLKVEKYLNDSGYFVYNVENHTDINNYYFGDATYHCVKKDGIEIDINVDYKQQTRSDGETAFIELIQVDSRGNYDSWLYNKNIHLVVYELKNGDCYIIPHITLIALAIKYNTETEWNRCIVYKKYHKDTYENERAWINSKLSEFPEWSTPLEDDNAFVNGCFNYTNSGKVHSGFCLNIHFSCLEKFLQRQPNTNSTIGTNYIEGE